jgi:hypothetical protein
MFKLQEKFVAVGLVAAIDYCPGFSLQVLAIRTSWLWAFRFNPAARRQKNILQHFRCMQRYNYIYVA